MKSYNNFITERKISYKKLLCPDIWENKVIIPRIEEKLLRIARDFYKELDVEAEIKDIILTGSITNFNYTKLSDLDVHIIIDFSEVDDNVELVKKAFDGQRFMWNIRHNIIIKEHDVELYVQDVNEENISSGSYSLMNHIWLKEPSYSQPNVDNKDVNSKYELRASDINEFEKLSKQNLDPYDSEQYYNKAKELKTKIMKSRKDGLSESGEFSIENLVFKKLRNEGKFKKLIDIIGILYDKIYSQ
jgi:predicted nucleotidyltransferase